MFFVFSVNQRRVQMSIAARVTPAKLTIQIDREPRTVHLYRVVSIFNDT